MDKLQQSQDFANERKGEDVSVVNAFIAGYDAAEQAKAADTMLFAQWVSHKGWKYDPSHDDWYLMSYLPNRTIKSSELYKIYTDEQNRK